MNEKHKIHINSFRFYDRDELQDLTKKYYLENQNLKEQVKYMRRSIERKEDVIKDLELERVPYTNKYVDKVVKEKQDLIKYLKKEQKKLEKNKLDYSADYYVCRKMFLKEILSKIEKGNK